MAILKISAFSFSLSILKPPSATTPSPAVLPPASFHARIWRPLSLSARSRAVDWATPALISSRSASKVDGKVSTFVDLTTYTVPEKSIHEFRVKDIDGNIVELSLYKGKVLLVVNVASQCSLTIQNYKELVQLYRRYQDQGLEILAFPCNQFGKQEPAISATIKSFAKTKFHVEFPLFNKVNVNGPYSAPLYKFLRIMKGDTFPGDQIKWNFAKFLVDKAGLPVARYVPVCSPLQIEDDIRKLLGLS